MKNIINRMSRFWYRRSLGVLLVRVATGIVFVAHGWMKIHNTAMVSGMMLHLGVFWPWFFGPFISWLEVIGGLMLILGIFTRPIAVALGIEMVFAIFLTGFGRGWSPHELEAVLALNSFAIALMASGRFALYPMECRQCAGMLCWGGENCPHEPER
ncbi:MAG TPA: DoxX family protein [Candidatus Paceibacterota bacterium]|nr:DoxX family protein [Candidatus Paceibacterota bacterium]